VELVKSTGTKFDHVASNDRIKKILSGADTDYEEGNSLPSRDRLTYSNGFYVNCAAMFVDIRGSSKLPDRYKRRPTLAKLYRAYISEVVAVMDGDSNCAEVNIVGDGVWGVFNTPAKPDIDSAFATACTVNTVMKILNFQLGKHGYDPIKVGIGLAWGRVLVVKAGLLGSGISDVVYMGDVVNQAAKLCAHGNETTEDKTIMVSGDFRFNLKEHNQGLLTKNTNRACWHCDAIMSNINDWFTENCK